MSAQRLLVLVVALAAGTALAWLALSRAEELPDWLPGPSTDKEMDPPPRARQAAPRSDVEEVDVPSAPGVPRILPSDVALEDIRDAYVGKQPDALTVAYAQIIGFARDGRRRGEMLSTIPKTDGATVRGIALAALGVEGSESTKDWIADRLFDSPFVGEQLGAMLGLCASAGPDTPRVRIESWHGIEIPLGDMPDRPRVWRAVTQLLDREAPADPGELLVLMPHVLREAPIQTFIDASGRVRKWIASLPSQRSADLREQLLARTDLTQVQRRALGG